MYTLELECEAGHRFEGWYDSAQDYEGALNRGELCCPVCDSEFIMRRSSAKSLPGKALMNLARRLKVQEHSEKDQAGSLYFKLLLD